MSWLLYGLLGFVVLIVFFFLYYVFSGKMGKEHLLDECKKRLDGQLPAFTNDDWGMILGAPYAAVNMYPCNGYSSELAIEGGLKSAWGINDRKGLIFQLYALLAGGHSEDYYDMKEQVSGISQDELNTLLENIQHSNLDGAEKKEITWQCTMMFNNQNNIQNIEYLAWDYVRFSMLCSKGCRLGYITEEEAKAWTLMLSPKLRETYNGWDELWESFIITRWFWSAKDRKWTRSQDVFSSVVDVLLQEKGSPATSIAWNAPLPSVDTSSFENAVAELEK